MKTGMIIGDIIAISIMVIPTVIYFRTKDIKETLTIKRSNDTIRLLLNSDEYAHFDISDIRDDQKRIDEELVKVIKARAKELVKFIDGVRFSKDGDEKFEQELFSIIQQAKT